MFGKDRTLFRVFGLPIKVNLTWLLLVALVVFTLGTGYFPAQLGRGAGPLTVWLMSFAGAAALFVCLLIHELCHSLVAKAAGMPVAGITLFLFGGVSQLEDEPPTALTEFVMAAAGPAASVVLAVGSFLLWILGLRFGWPVPLLALLQYLAIANLILAVFNSIPAFPLDGGRVLRSIVWGVTGSLVRATQVAVGIGSVFGFGLLLLGIFSIFQGGTIFGIWLIFIGFFARQAAAGSLQLIVMQEQLAGDTVRRFMTPYVVTLPQWLTVAEFVERYALHYRYSYYPVVDEAGKLLGLFNARSPRRVHPSLWPTVTVGQLASPADDGMAISADAEAAQALKTLRIRDDRRAVVVGDGRPVAMVTWRDLLGYVALKSDLQPRR